MNFFSKVLINVALRATILSTTQVSAQMPPAIAVREGTVIATLHAEGAQIYECKPDSGDNSEGRALIWQFREPIATLVINGMSIGRHYAGPSWDHADGSEVKGRAIGSAPGATSNDIPWLKIEAVEHRGSGILSELNASKNIARRCARLRGIQ